MTIMNMKREIVTEQIEKQRHWGTPDKPSHLEGMIPLSLLNLVRNRSVKQLGYSVGQNFSKPEILSKSFLMQLILTISLWSVPLVHKLGQAKAMSLKTDLCFANANWNHTRGHRYYKNHWTLFSRASLDFPTF